jgi:O-antigen/teichoic acid export membrane protein
MLSALATRVRAIAPLAELLEAVKGRGAARVVALGAMQSLTISVVGVGTAYVLQVILAQTLGETHYGTYVVVLAWMNLLLILSRIDLDVVSTRFAGAYAARAEWSLLRGLVRRTRQIVLLVTAAAGGIGAIGMLLRGDMEGPVLHAALWAAALLPVTGLLLLSAATLQGLKDVPGSQIPSTLLRPVLFMAGVVLFAWLSDVRLTAGSALALNLAATSGALMVSWFRLHRRLPAEVSAAPPAYATREWLKTGAWFVMIDLFQLTISQQSDILIVSIILSKEVAGHYSAASQLAALVQFGVTAVVFIVTPFISELYAKNNFTALRRLVSSTMFVSFLLATPIFVALLLLGRFLLSKFGQPFTAAYPALVLLGAGQLLGACIGTLAGTIMSMTGRQREAAWRIGVSAALNVMLALILVPRLGIIGSATATLIATAVRSALLAVHIHRHLGISLFALLARRS